MDEIRFQRLLAPCLVGEVTALLPYGNPLVKAVIQEAKFHGNKHAISLMGAVLYEYLLDLDTFHGESCVLVPIPLSPQRKHERGYNQVEKICAVALQNNSLTTHSAHVLIRTRNTLPQTTLTRSARLENMQGAFYAQPLDTSLTYIVIDDVVTTGATLADAVRALREAGALRILPIALAH